MKYKGVERRKFPRVKKDHIVGVRVKNVKKENWVMATVMDVSRGGILFLVPNKFSVGSSLKIELYHNTGNDPFELHGEVTRSEPMFNNILFQVAVNVNGRGSTDASATWNILKK